MVFVDRVELYLRQADSQMLEHYSKILNKRGARLSAELAVRRLLRTPSPARSVAYYGSNRPQTLGKRISDDLHLLIFRRRKTKID